jgi:hypothetical protein
MARPGFPAAGIGVAERPRLAGRAALRAAAAVILVAAVALSGHLLPQPMTPGAAAAATPPPDLIVLPVSTQSWIGTNDLLLEVQDVAGRSLAADGVPLELMLTAPSGATVSAVPLIERFATYGRPLYRARVPLSELGRWQVGVDGLVDGVPVRGSGVIDVSPDQGTPPLGSAVPGGDTPTMFDAMSLLHHISSDPEPASAFYLSTVDDALANHQPFVFILDTYAYQSNPACGGALGILHDIYFDYPGLTLIHAEPWLTRMDEDGMLTLDPPGGPAVPAEYTTAWGVTEPPWVFVVDKEGRLRAKFTGVIGSDELRAAIAGVTAWRPPG